MGLRESNVLVVEVSVLPPTVSSTEKSVISLLVPRWYVCGVGTFSNVPEGGRSSVSCALPGLNALRTAYCKVCGRFSEKVPLQSQLESIFGGELLFQRIR